MDYNMMCRLYRCEKLFRNASVRQTEYPVNKGNELITSSGARIRRILGGRSNVFVVKAGSTNLLIDTGPAFIGKKLVAHLRKLNIQTIDYLILTHTHFDHAANAHRIKEHLNPVVLVHRSESGFLSTGDSPLPEGTNCISRLIIRLSGKCVSRFVSYPPCRADILIDEEYRIPLPGYDLRLLHTPGHTMGSISLIVDHEAAIVGDTLFGVFPGRCFPPFADNPGDFVKSWKSLIATGCTVFLPSHGGSRMAETLSGCLAKRL